MPLQQSSPSGFQAITAIISRNVFLLINGIIFAVVILLAIFGDVQEGIFLGLITVLNMTLGCVQEITAWLALQKLQLLSMPKMIRINPDHTESIVLTEELKEKDKIKFKTGDQVPCDGVLIASHGFEVNEGLITGESTNFLRKPGDNVFAGSIVTAGSGILEIQKVFTESRIALMTKSIKKYSLVLSPIQHSINTVIKYTGYGLLVVIFFVVGRGLLVHEATVTVIQTIGALTSDLLPQGMALIITLFFSYGAVHLYRRNVLLQEVNAIEKIGRIKNLCMDKTGTLTDNQIVAEHAYVAPGVDEHYANDSIAAYIKGSGDSSQTINAVQKISPGEYVGSIVDSLGFSSARQFGAVHMKDTDGERVVVVGAPDVFLPYFKNSSDKEWVQQHINSDAKIGKRLICFAQSNGDKLPSSLSGIELSALSLFVLNNNLREGAKESVQFFQDRGVVIRIISGDHYETVQAVAAMAGVNNINAVITGAELETWTPSDFLEKTRRYTIFARTKPEQKEKIIEALKKDGFTAMVGDGANDALAIKKADLGIAMFDGAQATRSIASIVLVKNSFADLPNGVKLADSIIQNIKMCASIFFNQVFVGLFFFIAVTIGGYSFPLTPLNFTFINYFTVGLPGFLLFYWVIRPAHANIPRDDMSFLKQILPFACISAIPQAVIATFAFYGSLERIQSHGPTSLVLLTLIILGFVFFIFTPLVYSGPVTRKQKKQFCLLGVIEIISIVTLMNIPFIATFYNLKIPPLSGIAELVPFLAVYVIVQYGIARWFASMQSSGAKHVIS